MMTFIYCYGQHFKSSKAENLKMLTKHKGKGQIYYQCVHIELMLVYNQMIRPQEMTKLSTVK